MKKKSIVIPVVCLTVTAVLMAVLEFGLRFPLTWFSLNRTGAGVVIPARPGEVTLAFAGDIMAGDSLRFYRHRFGEDHPYLATAGLLRSADTAIGNLEGPVAVNARCNTAKRWAYKVDPASLPALYRAGFRAMTLANNHIRDCGNDGITESLRFLHREKIVPFGAGNSALEAGRPYIFEKNGLRIAVFGWMPPVFYWSRGSYSSAVHAQRPGQAGAAVATPRSVQQQIRFWRRRSGGFDLVLGVIHLGDRYSRKTVQRYRNYLHRLLDAGVDGLICHGTHIMGPVETYRGKPIAYGIGNYAFGSRNIRAQISLLAVAACDPSSKRISRVLYYPIYANNANPLAGHRSRFIQGVLLQQVQQEMIRSAAGLKTELKVIDGVVQQILPAVQRQRD